MQSPIKLVDATTWKQAANDARSSLGIIKATNGDPEFVDAAEVAEQTGKNASDSDRVVRMVMSRGDRDRDGDRISPKGWDLSHYEKNPVALFAHDYKELPIGKSLKTWVGDSKSGPVLRAMIQFATADLNPRGDMVYKLLKAGYLNAGSVGFIPQSYSADEKQEGEHADTRVGFRIDAAQLLENSIVPVGSHPGALAEARDAKIDLSPMVEWIERILDESKGLGLWIPRKDIENAWAIVRPTPHAVAHKETVSAPAKTVEERYAQAVEAVKRKRVKRTPRAKESPAPEPVKALGVGTAADCLSMLEQCAQWLFSAPTLTSEELIRLDAAVDIADGALDILLDEAGIEDSDDDDDAEPAKAAPRPTTTVLADIDTRAATPQPGKIDIDPNAFSKALRELLGSAAPVR